jgi:hypothetical protein
MLIIFLFLIYKFKKIHFFFFQKFSFFVSQTRKNKKNMAINRKYLSFSLSSEREELIEQTPP